MRSGDYYSPKYRHPRLDHRDESAGRGPEIPKTSSYTPGTWKNYVPHEISLSHDKRTPGRTPSSAHLHHPYRNEANYESNGEEDSRVRAILSSRREEERRRQESALKKVRELQDRVLPMVRGGGREDGEEVWVGWQSRVEQKLLRLEGQVDNMRREMELELERRVVELENRWEGRFAEYMRNGEPNG